MFRNTIKNKEKITNHRNIFVGVIGFNRYLSRWNIFGI